MIIDPGPIIWEISSEVQRKHPISPGFPEQGQGYAQVSFREHAMRPPPIVRSEQSCRLKGSAGKPRVSRGPRHHGRRPIQSLAREARMLCSSH